MTVRLPLVLGPNGLPEQLQSGDTLPLATAGAFGVVKPDGSSITIAGGVISSSGGGGGALTPTSISISQQPSADGGGDGQTFTQPFSVNQWFGYPPTITGNPNGSFGFGNVSAGSFNNNVQWGMNQNGFDFFGSGTSSKFTHSALSLGVNWIGAGQHIMINVPRFNGQGMSDTFALSCFGHFAGGPINGDEGQAFTTSETGMFQQDYTAVTVIFDVGHGSSIPGRTPCTINTTITPFQVIGSKNPQNICVASSAGVSVGDWVVLNSGTFQTGGVILSGNICNQSAAPNIAAVRVTAIDDTSDVTRPPPNIRGICTNNLSPGVRVTPALCMTVNDTSSIGQDRVLVNLSGATYSTGQVYQSGTPALTGVGGANWTNAMIGGDQWNIGAISVDPDEYSNGSFAGYAHQPSTQSITFPVTGTTKNIALTAPWNGGGAPLGMLAGYGNTISNAGTGYTPGVYLTAALTGGSGSGGAADITVDNTGKVTIVHFRFGYSGGGYLPGDVLSSSAIGPGVGFALTVNQIAGPTVLLKRTSAPYTTYAYGIVYGQPDSTHLNVYFFDGTASAVTATDWTVQQLWPNSGGPLRSWYQIAGMTSTTNMLICSNSTAGDASYRGRLGGVSSPGNYIIRPAVRVLASLGWSDPDGQQMLVCETSSHVWRGGDVVECAICPYADVYGIDYRTAVYTTGGNRRFLAAFRVAGPRKFDGGIVLGGLGSEFGTSESDAYAIGTAMQVFNAENFLTYATTYVDPAVNGGLGLGQGPNYLMDIVCNANAGGLTRNINDKAATIQWRGNLVNYFIGPKDANSGMSFLGCITNAANQGTLNFYSGTAHTTVPTANQDINLALGEFFGAWRLAGPTNSQDAYLEFGTDTGYSSPRVIINGITGSSHTGEMFQFNGFDFEYWNGGTAGRSAGTKLTMLSMGGGYGYSIWDRANTNSSIFVPFAGFPATAIATAGNNYPTSAMVFGTSVWHAGAANGTLNKHMALIAIPESGTDAKVALHIQSRANVLVGAGPTQTAGLFDNFWFRSDGMMFQGVDDQVSVGFYRGVRISAANIVGDVTNATPSTNVQDVAWPNNSGGINVIEATSSGIPANSQAAGVAGDVKWDTTHIYFCFATGTTAADRWFRTSGASSW